MYVGLTVGKRQVEQLAQRAAVDFEEFYATNARSPVEEDDDADHDDVLVISCDDKTGTDESSRRVAEWVKENVSTTGNPPVITEGSTVLQF
jgi:hypothetical protein